MQGCNPLKETVDLNSLNRCIKNFRHSLPDLILSTLFPYLIVPKMMPFLVYSNNKTSYPIARRLLAMRRYGGGMLYAALPLHMQRG